MRKNLGNLNKLFVIAVLGFSSGFPLAIISTTLQAYFATYNVSLKTIGFISLLSLPYSTKFLWAPFLDIISPFGKKRTGWILITQFLMVPLIFLLSYLSPKNINQQVLLSLIGFLIAFLSATQDISFDAYRTELFHDDLYKARATTISVFGYRIAMLVSGGFAIYLAGKSGSWHVSFLFMASTMFLLFLFTVLFAHEPSKNIINKDDNNFYGTAYKAFLNLKNNKYFYNILFFVLLYKIGDALALSLNTAFLIKTLHFSLEEVGTYSKLLGFVATICGMTLAGEIIRKLGLYRSLFVFGILQAIAHLFFMKLFYLGHNKAFMGVTMFVEFFASGMGTAAFIVFIMDLCNLKYTATQFALLSALSAVPRNFIGPVAGSLVVNIGWGQFYFLSFLASLPALYFLVNMKELFLTSEEEGYDATTATETN